MPKPRLIALIPAFLAVIAALALVRPGAAENALDSPEARLSSRIAELHAEVAVMEVECAASRENLLERLKKLGKLELGDRQRVLGEIRGEIEKMKMAGQMAAGGSEKVLEEIQREVEKRGDEEEKEQFKLLSDLMSGEDAAQKAMDRMADLELGARLKSVREESDRMKDDFRKKVRALYQKRQELSEAEAQYQAAK
jgi:hypothetical protein